MITTPAKYRWAWYGAVIGLVVTLSDLLLGWRNTPFASWEGDGITYNLGKFGGSGLGGAIIGLIAGSVRDIYARRSGRML
jgi:hypothetical protein